MALSLGAQAVWVGTRFVCAEEAGAPPNHQKGVIGAGYHDTVRSLIYTGRPLRILKTPYVMGWEDRPAEIKELTSKGVLPAINEMEQMQKEGTEFDITEVLPLLMGQAAGAIDDIKPAAEIMDEMMGTAIDMLRMNTARVAKL